MSRPPLALGFAEVHEVSKMYGRHRALHPMSLRLEPGRVTALLGPNGAGKTTLLWLFSTLSQPTTGHLSLGPYTGRQAQKARAYVNLVSHSALSYAELSGLENLRFFAGLHGMKLSDAALAEALDEFGLKKAMDRPVEGYSRGMIQRLSLCRAMLSKPELLLLDEPFTGLDADSRALVVAKIQALAEAGAMVLLVSHDLDTTAELADEQIILLRGRMKAYTQAKMTPVALKKHYQAVTRQEIRSR